MISTLCSKTNIRAYMLQKIKNIDPEEVHKQSKLLTQRVLSSPEYKAANSICIFLSMNHEINTEEILRDALHNHKKCFAPRVINKENMVMLRIYNMYDFETLGKSNWGIPEPDLKISKAMAEAHVSKTSILSKEATLEQECNQKIDREEASDINNACNLDLLLIPAVAVDTDHNRIGYGRGYYDRYLNTLKRIRSEKNVNPPETIVLILDQQVLFIKGSRLLPGDHQTDVEVIDTAIQIESTDYRVGHIFSANYMI